MTVTTRNGAQAACGRSRDRAGRPTAPPLAGNRPTASATPPDRSAQRPPPRPRCTDATGASTNAQTANRSSSVSSGAPTANGPAIGSASVATARTAQNPSLSTSSSTDEHPQLPYPGHRTNGPPPGDRRQGRHPCNRHWPPSTSTSRTTSTDPSSETPPENSRSTATPRQPSLARSAIGHAGRSRRLMTAPGSPG